MRKTDQQVKLIACSMLSFLLAGLPVSAVEAQSLDFTVGEKVALHRVYPNLDPFQSINEVQESEQVDTYHGVKVSDPFRWLENFQSNEVVNWVDGRDKYAKSRLRLPIVHGIYHRLEKYAIESRELPYKVSRRYFFSVSDGYTPRLYSLTRINARPVLVFDSAKVLPSGFEIQVVQVSPNEKIVAYALSKCGSDWTEWKFRHLLNNKLLTDTIRGTRGCDGIVWSPDCKGFFYSYFSRQSERFDPLAPISSAEIRFHRLGTKQSQDETVYRTGSPSMPSITCIGDFLLIDCEQAPGRHVLIKSLERSDSPVLDMFSSSSESFNFAGEMKNGNLLFSTDHDAPHYKFVSVNPKEFLSGKLSLHTEFEHKSATILSWVTFPERLVLHLMRDGRSYVEDYDWHGKLISRLNLPTDCDIELQAGDDECFIEVSNIVTPPTQYRYDMKSRKLSTIYRAQFPACDLSQYRMEQVSYKSRDGVTVSMYIAYKKGINLQSGKNPVLMEGYGGFREWQMPGFSNRALVWMDMGGIFCVPQIRGGIENGADWHRTATKVNKQRSFDDFIAAAEWLIEKRYTCPTRLAITGASNGGLLVAACITQRPELFGAACVDSGILDMVRFNRFGAGATFTEEYGSPDKKDEFDALYAYSPLHRVQPQTKYPATLIIARGSDDRVAPIHSYKFAAALQSSQSSTAPVLLRFVPDCGHSSSDFDTEVDTVSFLARMLSIDIYAYLGVEAEECAKRQAYEALTARKKIGSESKKVSSLKKRSAKSLATSKGKS